MVTLLDAVRAIDSQAAPLDGEDAIDIVIDGAEYVVEVSEA
jgi:hemin uptake protein HemP